ncbi:thiamine pyrophosphate TPP-binding domain-containing protein [Aureimonas endophytica]|uniref:Thiamine pyrophosphate TPP-binding domain-containing protein n=1 Tax=Aureimonas endophytica TaxID=2027858 RepID=A0A917A3R5_9HYPH|nr:thiamine pyrophosphate-dependent enzyme [Aureimonas endophytica]GGE25074.1 thiamine pyrophosphate TPP-binding domain-containing protein [Aureimonas endophytica]
MARNGGQLLVECLLALGATKGFGVPGESYLAVLDALHDTRGRLDYLLCRNEGGASFMAAAYGKLTGSPGLCFVTRGPGATNASIGIHTAMQDSSPMILFVGQVGTDMTGREAFQEVDYRAVFGSLAKWAVEIDQVERLPEIVARAWTTAVSGRPGPVVVALPEDMLTDETDVPPLAAAPKLYEAAPSSAAVAAAHDLLARSQRPVLLLGGTNWTEEGRTALQRFAEDSDIPVVAAFRYQDQFDNHSPVFVGEAGVGMPPHVRTLIEEADTILAVNVRFGEMTTNGYTLLSVPQPRQTLIHVHPSDREVGKVYVPALGIQAGPNAFAQALEPVQGGWAGWREEARAAYEASFQAPAQPGPVDMVAVTAWLRDNLPEDVILTNGAGNFTVWPNKFFRFGSRARLLAPQSGAMGYGVPAAIAAKAAMPARTVVCFAGDGDFQMNCQELGTAMQAGAQPIVLILNNGIYGTIRAHQERHYPERVSGTTLENPDFVGLAKSYGFHAEKVEATQDFAAAFGRALESPTGAVLELAVSPEAITPRQTLTQMRIAALNARKADV